MSEEPYNGNYVIMGKDFIDTTDENKISKFEIPKHIVFFYNDLKLVPNKVFENWKKLNPDYKLIFFDFKDTAYFLEKKFDNEHKNYFNKITYAAHKSDFFRMCFLYIYGGIYSDIDNEPLTSLNDFFEPYDNIKFLTCLSLTNNAFAQAIISTTRNNSFMKKCLDDYISVLEQLKNNPRYAVNYKGAPLSGTGKMYNAIKNILIENKQLKNNFLAHTKYVVFEKYDKKTFANSIVLLDEYTPNGRWQNSHMRTGYKTVLKCRYENYPWFNHDRNPVGGYETNF